jgi:hypothetical protein
MKQVGKNQQKKSLAVLPDGRPVPRANPTKPFNKGL